VIPTLTLLNTHPDSKPSADPDPDPSPNSTLIPTLLVSTLSFADLDAAPLHDRATLEPLDHKPLLRIGAVDVTAGDLRAYATLLWVGKAAIIGYVTVSITQRGGPGGVRAERLPMLLT